MSDDFLRLSTSEEISGGEGEKLRITQHYNKLKMIAI